MPLSSNSCWGIHHGYVSVSECWNRQTVWGETEWTNVLYNLNLMAGLSWNILCWSACYQDLLLTHLWSTALWDWMVVGARHHITQPPRTPGRCVCARVLVRVCARSHFPVCLLSSFCHCSSHFALSMVSPTVVPLLHSAHRHRHTLSEPHTNIPLTMSTERRPTAHWAVKMANYWKRQLCAL